MALNNAQYLLTKLSEECNEVGQMAAKTIQFGLQEVYNDGVNQKTNRERLIDELNDLMGVIQMLNDEAGLNYLPDPDAIRAKGEKVRKYRGYSVALGQVHLEAE